MSWKFNRNRLAEERIAKAEASERKANLAQKPAVATQEVVERMVARTGKPYFDTYDELERIYQEVKAETAKMNATYTWVVKDDGVLEKVGGKSPEWIPPYVSEPKPPYENYEWQVYKVPEKPKNPKDLKGLQWLIDGGRPKPPVEPPPQAAPVFGKTLDELFAEDEAEGDE